MEYPFHIALSASAVAALTLSCGSVAELETPLPEPMDASDTSISTEGGIDVDASLGSDESDGSDSAADLSESLIISESGDSAPEAIDESDSVGAVEAGTGCLNGLQDGTEQGPDCGGECPLKCPGSPCAGPEDCITESCANGVCSAPCVQKLALGFWHACALKRDGTFWCWGDNSSGQLGTGSFSDVPVKSPVQTVGMPGIPTQISLGAAATYARFQDGTLWAWGDNYKGELGDGTTEDRALPAQVVGLSGNVVQVSAGGAHVCALTSDSSLWCWGDNLFGQVGDGTTVDKTTPVQIAIPAGKVVQVSAGFGHTCALGDNSSVWCWGDNTEKQLGIGGTDPISTTPVPVPDLPNGIVDIVVGDYLSCVRTALGEVRCWGTQGLWQADPKIVTPKPKAIAGLPVPIHNLVVGDDNGCALDAVGALWCWGGNVAGQIADIKYTYFHSSPSSPCDTITMCISDLKPFQKVPSGYSIVGLAAKHNSTCGLTAKGEAWCWGTNDYGQVGDGTINKDECNYCPHPQPGKVLLSCE